MIGVLEIRRRKFQFVLIALIVTLISYLVLMINGLGVGLNEQAGERVTQFRCGRDRLFGQGRAECDSLGVEPGAG